MLISTKGRYALRVLIDMAEHQPDAYLPLKEIATMLIMGSRQISPSPMTMI